MTFASARRSLVLVETSLVLLRLSLAARLASMGGFEKFVTTFNSGQRALLGDLLCFRGEVAFEGFCTENLRGFEGVFSWPMLSSFCLRLDRGLSGMLGDVGERISAPVGEEKGIRGTGRNSVRNCAGSCLDCWTIETMIVYKSSFCLGSKISGGKCWDARVTHGIPRKCCTVNGVSPADNKT